MAAQDLESEEQEIVAKVLYVSVTFSIVGSLFIIFTYLIFKKSRTPGNESNRSSYSLGTKLVLLLSISDLLTSISWLPWNVNSVLCVIQAASLQFFQTASFFWSLIICFSLFQVRSRVFTDVQNFRHFIYKDLTNMSQSSYFHIIIRYRGGITLVKFSHNFLIFFLVSIIFCLVYEKFGYS